MYVGEWERGSDAHAWWKGPHVQAHDSLGEVRVVFLGDVSTSEQDRVVQQIRAGKEIAASALRPRWSTRGGLKAIVLGEASQQRFMPNDSSLYLDQGMLAGGGSEYVALCLVFVQTYLFLRDSRFAALSNVTLRKECYLAQEEFLRSRDWPIRWVAWVKRERWIYTRLNREPRPTTSGHGLGQQTALRGAMRGLGEYLILGPLVVLGFILSIRRSRAVHEGIRIVDRKDEPENSGFLHAVVDALSLMRACDSRRYRRVLLQIRFVVNSDIPSGTALYVRPGRVCLIDFSKYRTTLDEFGRSAMLERIAASLVHESTHGKLDRIPYVGHQRARVEALCAVEAYRILKELDGGP